MIEARTAPYNLQAVTEAHARALGQRLLELVEVEGAVAWLGLGLGLGLGSGKSYHKLKAVRRHGFLYGLETQECCATVARPSALARPAESSASPALSRTTGCAGCQKCRARCAAAVSVAGSSAPPSSRPLQSLC
eukprot:scaffold409_cov64-Phaeocystis_antarctica.AAC.2